jgi:hypothetical protein
MLQLILINIAVSIIVGLLGRNRKFGFWGYFFASLLLTPILGLLLVVASAKKPRPGLAARSCDEV